MEVLIWALGSAIALIIILFVLPLGFTIKGRFLIVITGFVLSLGGLAAVTTFPLWQTALILTVLVFFTAYIMNNRLGATLFKTSLARYEELDERDVSELNYQIEDDKNDSLLEMSKTINSTEQEIAELINEGELNFDQPQFSMVEALVTEEELDEEISILLDRSEKDENKVLEIGPDVGYLSDIEGMLAEERDTQEENLNQSWLEELEDTEELVELTPITLDKESSDLPKTETITTEMLIAVKEAAASKDTVSLPIKK